MEVGTTDLSGLSFKEEAGQVRTGSVIIIFKRKQRYNEVIELQEVPGLLTSTDIECIRFTVDTIFFSCSMSDPDYKNPFAALFPCSDENDAFKAGVIPSEIIDRPSKSGECGSQESSSSEMQSSNVAVSKAERHNITHFYEEVFRVTLSKEPCCQKNGPASLIFLNEVHVALSNQTEIDEQCIDRVFHSNGEYGATQRLSMSTLILFDRRNSNDLPPLFTSLRW
ncbi:ubiquitin conjugation factor E4 A [Trichonephila clavipes]|nr:ubiquitin conjugation factor E4 A [Trichonephila clavipes]